MSTDHISRAKILECINVWQFNGWMHAKNLRVFNGADVIHLKDNVQSPKVDLINGFKSQILEFGDPVKKAVQSSLKLCISH